MASHEACELKQAVFEIASDKVVKNIDRGKLHSVPSLNVSNQYELFQVLEVHRSKTIWQKPVYVPMDIPLKRLMGEVEGTKPILKRTIGDAATLTLPATTSWHDLSFLGAEATRGRELLVSSETMESHKLKMLCDLGPLQKETVGDRAMLNKWIRKQKVNYDDPALKAIKVIKDRYLDGTSSNSLCVITSIWSLMEEGKVSKVASPRIQQDVQEFEGHPGSGHLATKFSNLQVVDDESECDLLGIPKGTIIAFGVHHLIADESGKFAILPDEFDSHGKFVKALSEIDLGIQECCQDTGDEPVLYLAELDICSSLSDDFRGPHGRMSDLLLSPDVKIVRSRFLFEKVNEADEVINTSALAELTAKAAIAQLRYDQRAAIRNLRPVEAFTAVDKVLKNKLFFEPFIRKLPCELNTETGIELLWQLNIELDGEGCVLMDNKVPEVQCEMIAARIVIRALYDLPNRCGAEEEACVSYEAATQRYKPEMADNGATAKARDVHSHKSTPELSVIENIDKDGGTIIGDNILLHIPAGAVDKPVMITMTQMPHKRDESQRQIDKLDLSDVLQAGVSVSLQPHGHVFKQSVALWLTNVNILPEQQLVVLRKDVSSQSDPPWIDVTDEVPPERNGRDIIFKLNGFSEFTIVIILSPPLVVATFGFGMAAGVAAAAAMGTPSAPAIALGALGLTGLAYIKSQVSDLWNNRCCMYTFTVYYNSPDLFLTVICQLQDKSQGSHDTGLELVGQRYVNFLPIKEEQFLFYFDINELQVMCALDMNLCTSCGQHFHVPLRDGGRHKPKAVFIRRESKPDVTLCLIPIDENKIVCHIPEDKKWETALRRVIVVWNIDVRNSIFLDILYRNNVIEIREMSDIKDLPTPSLRVQKLVDIVISKGAYVIPLFLEALDQTFPHISSEIRALHMDPYAMPFDSKWRKVLRQHHLELVRNIREVDVITDFLFSKDVINNEEIEHIRVEVTSCGKVRELLCVVTSKDDGGIELFVQSLENNNFYLFECLHTSFKNVI